MRDEIGSKMVTDDERRRVAERLRGLHDYETANVIVRTCLGLRPGMLMDKGTRRRMGDFIADLIDPDSHPIPKFDPTERGIDSIYEWCRERLEGADGAEDYLYCTIMRAIEDYRHPGRATAYTVRAVDREALLALADEMDHPIRQAVWNQTAGVRREHIMAEYARHIREALGVVS